jgi:glutamine phosphoribosylpyrophosphate amidotransferase
MVPIQDSAIAQAQTRSQVAALRVRVMSGLFKNTYKAFTFVKANFDKIEIKEGKVCCLAKPRVYAQI